MYLTFFVPQHPLAVPVRMLPKKVLTPALRVFMVLHDLDNLNFQGVCVCGGSKSCMPPLLLCACLLELGVALVGGKCGPLS